MKRFRQIASVLIVLLIIVGMLIPIIAFAKSISSDKSDWTDYTQTAKEYYYDTPTEPDDGLDDSEWFINSTNTIDPASQPATESDETDPTETPELELEYWMNLTDDEIWILATAVYLEGRGESIDCQEGICSVILNRMTTRDQSLTDVIYSPGQFSVAYDIKYSMPDDIQIGLVHEILMNSTTLPECVTFFRAGKYHDRTTVDTTYIKPYIVIDNTYFSHDIRICGDNH